VAALKSRLFVRTTLILILAATAGLGVVGWQRTRPEALWERAQRAIAAGDSEEASLLLKDLLKQDPDHADGHLAMAKLLKQNAESKHAAAGFADAPAAMEHLERAARLRPNDPEILRPLLEAYSKSGKTKRALDTARRLLKQQPQHPEALLIVIRHELSRGEISAAVDHLDTLRATGKTAPITLLGLSAELHKRNGDSKRYDAVLAASLKRANERTGKIAHQELATFDRLHAVAVANAPTAAEADRRIDLALRFQERRCRNANKPVPAAMMAYRLVQGYLQAHPANGPQRKKTVRAVLDRAVAITQAAVKARPGEPKLERNLVTLVRRTNDHRKILEITEAGLKRLQDAENRDADLLQDLRLVIAESCVRLGRYRSARPHIDHLIRTGHSRAHVAAARLLSGSIHAHEGRHQAALAEFLNAETQGTLQGLARHYGLAKVYVALRRWQDARPHLMALKVEPDDLPPEARGWAKRTLGDGSAIRFRLAQTYLANGEHQRADALLESLRGTAMEASVIGLQVLQEWRTNPEAAQKRLSEARKTFPHNFPLAALDVKIRFRSNRPAEAKQIAAELARAKPDNLAAQTLLYSVAMTERDYDGAVRILDDLIKRFPDKPVLVLTKARTLLLAKKHKQAAEVAATLADDPHWKAAAEFYAALAALRSQNLDEAAQRLERAAKAQRQLGTVNLLKGRLSLSQGKPEEAIRDLTAALRYSKIRNAASSSLWRSFRVLARQKTPQDALQTLTALQKQQPGNTSLLLAKSELESRVGDFAASLATLKQLEKTHPNNLVGPYYQAKFWSGMKQPERAKVEIDRALKIAPHYLPARLMAANIALQANRPAEALAHVDAALGRTPYSSALLLLRATVLLKLKQPQQAVSLLEKLTDASPKSVSAWLMLARIHAAAKRETQCLSTLAAARKRNPGNSRLIRESIRYLIATKRISEADHLAAEFVGENPAFKTRALLAAAYHAAGDSRKAQSWAEKVLAQAVREKNQKRILAAKLLLADLAIQQGRRSNAPSKHWAEAQRILTDVLKDHPGHLTAANNLAWLLATQLNDPVEARNVIEPILNSHRIDRLPTAVMETILDVFQANREYDKAAAWLADAMRIQPGHPKWIREYVRLCMKRNRLHEAIPVLEEMHRKRGWWAEPSYALGRVYHSLGRQHEAMRVLQRATAIDSDHLPVRLLLVEAATAAGDHAVVIKHADVALKRNPNLWQVHRRKAEALTALNRTEEADRLLDQVIHRVAKTVEQKPTRSGYLAHAKLLRMRKNDEQALKVLLQGLETLPGDFPLLTTAVDLLLKQGQRAEADALITQHLAEDASASRLVALGQVYYRNTLYAPARQWGRRALARATGDENVLALVHLGHTALFEGEASRDAQLYAEAKRHYEAVLRLQPDHFVAGNNLAYLLAGRLNQPEAALKIAERIRGDAPVERLNRDFVDTLSLVYRKAKRWEKAKSLLQQATAIFPQHGPFHCQLGEVYFETRDFRAAYRAVQRGMELQLNDDEMKRAGELLARIQETAKL